MNSKKDILRQICRLNRNAVKERDVLSGIICDKLLESEIYKACDSIFLYASCSSEVSTEKIISQAFADSKKVAFPKCLDKDGNMRFYFVSSFDEMLVGHYGIMAPPEHCEAGFGNGHTLCVVPGIAFNPDGYRIGYGKGYYDRFLSCFKGKSVGLCFDECLIDEIPTDGYDRKVDYLITDKKIYKTNIKEE